MDRLEKYVKEHRSEFDRAVPDLKVWGAIAGQLPDAPPARRLPWYRRTQWVAAAAMLLFVGVVGVYWCSQPAEMSQTPAVANPMLASIDPELAKMEAFYQQRFAEGYAELAAFSPEPAVQRDLQQMDAVLEELRVELADAPPGARTAIVEAMLQHYKIKIELLEHILAQLRAAAPNDLNDDEDEISI